MYRIIMLSIMAIAVSSCSSIKKMASAVGKQAEYRAGSYYTKSEFISKYALTEDEYKQWEGMISAKAMELFTSNGAKPPVWENGNQLYLKNNPLHVITFPESEVKYIKLALNINNHDKLGMLLLQDNGIYFISYYSEQDSQALTGYKTIFKFMYSNFESILWGNPDLGDIAMALANESNKYLKPKSERKKQEEDRLAKEAERLEKERISKELSDKRKPIEEQAKKIIGESKNRKINTLQLRELYLGMPATECATLLNYYMGLPSESESEYYKANSDKSIITPMPLVEEPEKDEAEEYLTNALLGMFGIAQLPDQKTENNQLTRLILIRPMVDKIFNASSLSAQEFAQAMVDNYPLVKNLTGDWNTQCWQYTDQDRGFRITITENKELILEKIATTSDLTF